MAQVKDKVITVESLSALHDYNQKTYLPMVDPEVIGNLNVEGNLDISGSLNVNTDLKVDGNLETNTNLNVGRDLFVSERLNVGTNFSVDGEIILSQNQYGDELPPAGTVGRIFFKRLIE